MEWACRSNSPALKPDLTNLRPAWESTIEAVYCGLLGYSAERLEELKTQRVI